jgi:hypothetical protein
VGLVLVAIVERGAIRQVVCVKVNGRSRLLFWAFCIFGFLFVLVSFEVVGVNEDLCPNSLPKVVENANFPKIGES